MLDLNNSKLPWHYDRLEAWHLGERIAPITVDLALTRACNFRCEYCYSQHFQKNPGKPWSREMIVSTWNDFAEIGVKAISLVSDGESTLNHHWIFALEYAKTMGLDIALGTNGYSLLLPSAVQHCTYLRINISAATRRNYCKVHGVNREMYDRVLRTIHKCVSYKRESQSNCTIGLQMVCMPDYADEILPLTYLAKGLGVDYLQIKHVSDNEKGELGVDYDAYEELYPILEEAESLSDDSFQVIVKWNKLREGNRRSYQQCYGPPFHLQISGSGLVCPCGMLFSPNYSQYHIGNLHQTSFKEIWQSERYWLIMNELRSEAFNAETACGCLCLQHSTNVLLDNFKKGKEVIQKPEGSLPPHCNFL